MSKSIPFLITIDTEGDDSWSRPSKIFTKNALHIPRFQKLCEDYGFKPTYLTNYEMAEDEFYVDFAKDAISRGQAEVGMHLHAWHSPPWYDLTGNDYHYQPFLIEYPENLIREKVGFLTNLLEEKFARKILSHRAGRWAFNSIYAKVLVDYGYEIDCSVTPSVSWVAHQGDPKGKGGTDYTDFPKTEYFMDIECISQQGSSNLLELPMTILSPNDDFLTSIIRKTPLVRKIINRYQPSPAWLRPNGFNMFSMKAILNQCKAEGRSYVEFMTHSSELMPGGCSRFPDQSSVDRLYDELEDVFSYAKRLGFIGMTLSEYRQLYLQGNLT